MADQPIKTSLEALALMLESEKTVAEFYLRCSERFAVHRNFWAALAKEEMAHARVINALMELVRVQPTEFIAGKSTPLNAIKSFIKRTQSNIETVTRSDVQEDKALLMAYQIENTFIELQYGEVVNTENEVYKPMLGQIISDTLRHKDKITARIKKMREAAIPSKKSS